MSKQNTNQKFSILFPANTYSADDLDVTAQWNKTTGQIEFDQFLKPIVPAPYETLLSALRRSFPKNQIYPLMNLFEKAV